METNDDRHVSISSSRICSRRLSRSPNGHSFDSSSRNNQLCYTTLIGPDDPRQLVDCQIILVNPRQRLHFFLINKTSKKKIYSEVMVKRFHLIFVVMV